MQTTEAECPLCMEQLEIDDVNFFPCTCGYQICRFCWHRIRTDENGLCPACRKPYSEDPAVYTPLSQDEIQRILKERKQKDVQRKQKVTENRKHLANVRVVQKNLVFVVGLTQRLADPELLKRPEYFTKFGKIHKIVVNSSTNYAGPQGPSASAYITYAREEDAIKAIIAVCNTHLDGRTLKASLGTTKYCSYFLRNIPCPKPDCMYLHELGDGAGSFTKEDMQAGKHQEYEQQLIAFYSRKMELNNDKEPKEDWTIGGASESTAATCLPSRASWAGKGEEDTNIQHVENEDNSIPVCEEDWEDPSTPTLVAPKHGLPSTITQQQPTTQQQQQPTQAQLPQSSTNTGWEKVENPPQGLESTSGLFSGDLCSGLGLSNLHLKVYGEDDLGFDPWNECSKGLADLLQEEEETKPEATAAHSQNYMSTFQRDGDDIRNWQDGLRALLPNINISFSGRNSTHNSLASRQQETWPSAASYVTETRSSNWSASASTQQPQGSWQVRPPPGFESKSPPAAQVPMVDDPSILWSKTVNTDNLQINKPITRPLPNGFPGMHPLTRPTDLQGPAAAASGNKLISQLAAKLSQNREQYTEKTVVKGQEPDAVEICRNVGSKVGYNLAQEHKTRVSELSVIQLDDPLYRTCQGGHSLQDNPPMEGYLGGDYQETKKQPKSGEEEGKRGKRNRGDKKHQQNATQTGTRSYEEKQSKGGHVGKNVKASSISLQFSGRRKDHLSNNAEKASSGDKDLSDGARPAFLASHLNSSQSYCGGSNGSPRLAGTKSLPTNLSRVSKRGARGGSSHKQRKSHQGDNGSTGFPEAGSVLLDKVKAFLNETNFMAQNT